MSFPLLVVRCMPIIGAVLLAGCAAQDRPSMSLGLASTGEAESVGQSLVRGLASVIETGDDETHKLSPRLVEYGETVPKGGGVRKIGTPYVAAGRTVVPKADPDYDQTGIASWYGAMFHGRKTANGEIYDMDALTAAHPTLPLPSYVKVTHLANNRSLVVRVNDRGPFKRGRIIDLSRRAAQLLSLKRRGTAPVRVTFLKPAPLDGDDSFEQAYLESRAWYRGGPTRLGSAATVFRASMPGTPPEDG